MPCKRTLALALAALLAGSPAVAGDKKPYIKPDRSWISISGTALSTTADSFTLDYGDGKILVEMDDWDGYGEAAALLDGDKVTVHGRIDADLYERRTIEASSVYVESLGTYFYANSADEEGGGLWMATSPIVAQDAVIYGSVTKVMPKAEQFVVDSGTYRITVETDQMLYDPYDDYGFQKIEVDDYLRVTGTFDTDFLEGRVFEAATLTTLVDEDDRGGK